LRFAGVLQCLQICGPDSRSREALAEAGAIPHLVRMLADVASSVKTQRHAATTLAKMCCCYPFNRAEAIKAGAIPALVRRLGSSSDVALSNAILGALIALTKATKGEVEMAAAGGIPLLLYILSDGDATLHMWAGALLVLSTC
jgi:hypothetical protein